MRKPAKIKKRVVAGVSAIMLSLFPSLQYPSRLARAQAVQQTEMLLPDTPAPAPEVTEAPVETPAETPTEAPVEATEAPEETEAPAETAPVVEPTAESTQPPEGTPVPEATEAPDDPATEEGENAAEMPDFRRGYAYVLRPTTVFSSPHAREGSTPMIALAKGESVRVRGRVAYVPGPDEDAEGAPDWFEVVIWDVEGTKVTGYAPGICLLPYTQAELLAQEKLWQYDPASRPQDGIPQVSGLAMQTEAPQPGETAPPPRETPSAPRGTPPPSPTAEMTPDPAESAGPEASGEIESTENPEATLDPDATPTVPPPTDILSEIEMPEAGALENAQALLDAPFGGDALMQLAIYGAAPDVIAPVLDDIKIVSDPSQSTYVTVVATVLDEADPADPYATVSGVSNVTLTASGGAVHRMLPTGQANVYAVVLYVSDTYTLNAVDYAGNALATPYSFPVTIAAVGTADTTAPMITDPQQEPTGVQVDNVTLSCVAEDPEPTNPAEDWSKLAGVWVQHTQDGNGNALPGILTPMPLNETTGRYTYTASLNGVYVVTATDWAGNEAQHSFTVGNIRPADTWAPIVRYNHLDNDEPYQEYAVTLAEVYDEQNPNDAGERISGLVTVGVAMYYGQDPDTGKIYYGDLIPATHRTEEDPNSNWYSVTIYDNMEYVWVAVDEAGNTTTVPFVVENVGEKFVNPDPDWIAVNDDDQDGIYSVNEYKLGLNPAQFDSNGDGLSDGLSVLLGLGYPNLMEDPAKSLLTRESDSLEAMVEAGVLGAGVSENNPREYRARQRSQWQTGRNVAYWWNPRTTEVACIGTSALMRFTMPVTETPTLEGALSFYALGMGKTGDYSARTLSCTADGRMGLLYDREGHGGKLKADAYLVDMHEMVAYPILDTAGARNIAMNSDGTMLAVLRADSFEVVHLDTGKIWRTEDADEISRIDVLHFLAGGQIVTRVTPLGYNAYHSDGQRTVGDAVSLPVITQYQDNTQITVVDLTGKPLTMAFHAQLRSSGIYVTSEDEKVKAMRHVTPTEMVRYANLSR